MILRKVLQACFGLAGRSVGGTSHLHRLIPYRLCELSQELVTALFAVDIYDRPTAS